MNTEILEQIEKEVMQSFRRCFDEESSKIIEQSELFTEPRDFTGIGYYLSFSPPSHLRLPIQKQILFVSNDVQVDTLENGIGYQLSIKDGKLTYLEACTYCEPWPLEINEFEVPSEAVIVRSNDPYPPNGDWKYSFDI